MTGPPGGSALPYDPQAWHDFATSLAGASGALLALAGVAATATSSIGGLYWMAAAMAAATTSGIITSWVLVVEIKR